MPAGNRTPLPSSPYLSPLLLLLLLLLFLLSAVFIDFFPVSSPTRASSDTFIARPVDGLTAEERLPVAFTELAAAFALWDGAVGCERFREKHRSRRADPSAIQDVEAGGCPTIGASRHISILVKGWTWIPDELESLYSCRCGLTCLWTKSSALADKPDALFFEWKQPPETRKKGEPLRIYMDLEASRHRTGYEDIFVGFHAMDDVQCTYAGTMFHKFRNYHVSSIKRNDVLVYWSSSNCIQHRTELAQEFFSLISHHSFGSCLNNVGGRDAALSFYPDCKMEDPSAESHWWDHLHCAMSHYKFVLAIENTKTDSYVTEKLYYALDAGSVPIYFGASDVESFVPPHSIIDGSKFGTLQELASYVKVVADDPIAYSEYHAWRRCGVMGHYGRNRATALDTLPCRLCEYVSRKGGRDAE